MLTARSRIQAITKRLRCVAGSSNSQESFPSGAPAGGAAMDGYPAQYAGYPPQPNHSQGNIYLPTITPIYMYLTSSKQSVLLLLTGSFLVILRQGSDQLEVVTYRERTSAVKGFSARL